jgi:hypothetical protein
MKANPFTIPAHLSDAERADAHAAHAEDLLSAADMDPRGKNADTFATRGNAHATLALFYAGRADR